MTEIQPRLTRASRVAHLEAMIDRLGAAASTIPAADVDWLMDLLSTVAAPHTDFRIAPGPQSQRTQGLLFDALSAEFARLNDLGAAAQELHRITRLFNTLVHKPAEPLDSQNRDTLLKLARPCSPERRRARRVVQSGLRHHRRRRPPRSGPRALTRRAAVRDCWSSRTPCLVLPRQQPPPPIVDRTRHSRTVTMATRISTSRRTLTERCSRSATTTRPSSRVALALTQFDGTGGIRLESSTTCATRTS